MARGWNISHKNLKEIFQFIDNFEPKNDLERRNKKILQYAFVDNLTALQISKLNDIDIVSYSNNSKGKPLSNAEISRIIRDYNLIKEKRVDYIYNQETYKRRKEITKKIQKKEINKPKICGCCGNKKGLQLHHIIPICKGGNDAYYNLIYLCYDCHKKIHKYVLKENNI